MPLLENPEGLVTVAPDYLFSRPLPIDEFEAFVQRGISLLLQE